MFLSVLVTTEGQF